MIVPIDGILHVKTMLTLRRPSAFAPPFTDGTLLG